MYFSRKKNPKFIKRRHLISIQEEKASREKENLDEQKKNLYNSVINDKKRRMNKIIKAFSPLSIIWFQDDDGCDIENDIGHIGNDIEHIENDIKYIENDINSEFTINTQTNNSVVFKIQTSDILFNIAKSFVVFLQKHGFQANIASTKEINTEIKNKKEDSNTIYIFLFIGMISKIPVKSKFYIYNLEQMQYYQNFEKFVGDCNWESGVIMNELFSNAERVFDYSEKNLDFYPNYLQHKVKYLPIPFNLKKRKNINIEKKYDILFFGTQNQRRRKIINYLKKNTDFKILAFSNIFDEELFDYIKKSKVVVNLHFKMSALLETARIQDCLDGIFNYNTFFISETSIDKNTMDNYEHLVEFIQPIKTNFSNIYTLIDKLTKIINNDQKSNTELIKTSVLNLNKINKKQYSYFITNYGDSLTKFKYFYNIDNKTELNNLFKTNKKMAHRYKCYSKISIIKNIIINNFGDKSNQLETILIEFRLFPHLEFLLRNTIIKLPNWNHTIVCGNNNFEFMVQICENICNNTGDKIKIIKLDIDNLLPSEYSQLLTSSEFWNNFEGEKLLVYQEDSVLFHKNIEPFLKFDYIGAPWPINQDDNSYGVGNGGFSLRSKSTMLQCLETIKPEDLKLGKSTLDYMKNTKSDFVPEDVYFSKTMIDYNIGIVAPRHIAKDFSQETQLSVNPLGGHNYWLVSDILKNTYKCERVGIYSPYDYLIGGGEYYLSMLIKFLIKCGAKHVHFYNHSGEKMFKNTLMRFFTPAEISIIKKCHIHDIVDNHTYDYFIEMGNQQYPILTKRKISKTFIYHCQFPFDHYNPKVNIKQMNNVDYILLNSDYTQKYYKKKLHNKDYHKLIVNYPACFKKQLPNKKIKEPNTFVMIGRIHEPNMGAHNKCHLDIIKIFRKLISHNIPFKLYIIGTIQNVKYYNYLKSLEIKDHIIIIGDCLEEKKHEIIDKCQYHIHATGINLKEQNRCFSFEHFGISTIECINRGCIPICVNGGFFPFYIEHLKNGFLYNTTDELTHILEKILKSKIPHHQIEEINKINKNIIEKFSESAFFDRLTEMLL
jgi:hypothetical protein